MSARAILKAVLQMQPALTQREVSFALVTLATLEMESTVQVGHYLIIYKKKHLVCTHL